MKNIFAQKLYNKFINNIDQLGINAEYSCSVGAVNDIYKQYYKNKYNVYIFCANMITDEIISFINDNMDNDILFIFYHNKPNKYIYKLFNKHKHIIDEDNYTDFGQVIPKNIINADLYENTGLQTKEDIIPIFLENYASLPDYIADQLYPNTKKRILMFNNKNIKNDQNIGFLSETDRRDILQRAKYYACDNEYYMIEAQLSGCEILDIHNLEDTVDVSKLNTNYVTYKNFIAEIIR